MLILISLLPFLECYFGWGKGFNFHSVKEYAPTKSQQINISSLTITYIVHVHVS